MTREEIIKSHLISLDWDASKATPNEMAIYFRMKDAIDEYAHIESIEFSEWCVKNASNHHEYNECEHYKRLSYGEWRYKDKTVTTKELYKLFKCQPKQSDYHLIKQDISK